MSGHKEYTNGEITITWKPDLCIHSGNCVKGLGAVFNPKDRPWINMNKSNSAEIINTVNTCPSGALTYLRNSMMTEKSIISKTAEQNKTNIKIIQGGPIMVEGSCSIIDKEGNETIKEGKIFLCRCGGSKNKPYCDGTHKTVEFDK